MVGEGEEVWTTNIQKIENDQLELIRTSSHSAEKAVYKKTNINKDLAKTIPQVLEHEDSLYVTLSSSTLFKGREIFRVELLSDRDVNNEEIEEFYRYKEILNQ